ncbi:hypothetical protein M885DRAFT_618265 [Pelagophyceae sp. CCMP2097]|nr:hypothetical protein M885DRAFT_618265 [Pelagophyceae sp. CCMP2097]
MEIDALPGLDGEADEGLDFSKFTNPLERFARVAHVSSHLEKFRTVAGRGIEAFKSEAQKFSFEELQARDPYMVAGEPEAAAAFPRGADAFPRPRESAFPRPEEEQAAFPRAGNTPQKTPPQKTPPQDDASPSRGTGGTGGGDVAAALAAERARHKVELANAKENALRIARVAEQSGVVEAKVLRQRLTEAGAEVEALKKELQRASRESSSAKDSKNSSDSAASSAKLKADDLYAENRQLRSLLEATKADSVEARSAAEKALKVAAASDAERTSLELQLSRLSQDGASAASTISTAAADCDAARRILTKRDGELAAIAKAAAATAHQLQAALDRARTAEAQAAKLRGKLQEALDAKHALLARPEIDEPRLPAAFVDAQAVSREVHAQSLAQLTRLRDVELPALERLRADAERLAAESRRAAHTSEAAARAATSRSEAVSGRLAAFEAERTAALAERDALATQLANARSTRERVVDDSDLKMHTAERKWEAMAAAAKRQVRALDSALDGAHAEMAANSARALLDKVDMQSLFEAKAAEALKLKTDVESARGMRAFYFSGELRAELGRLERANQTLRKNGGADGGAHVPSEKEAAPHRDLFPAEAVSETEDYEPRTRLQYIAAVILRLCDEENDSATKSRAKDVAPVLRTLLRAPHNDVAAWLAGMEEKRAVKHASAAFMALVIDALRDDDDSLDALHRVVDSTKSALTSQILLHEGELAELRDSSEADLAQAVAAVVEEAKAAREALELQLEEASQAAQGALRNEIAALRNEVDLFLKTSPTDQPLEAEHARQCLVTILQEGSRGGATYNRLLPVVRQLLKQPHVVIQRNVDALLGTGSGTQFIIALLSMTDTDHRVAHGDHHDHAAR